MPAEQATHDCWPEKDCAVPGSHSSHAVARVRAKEPGAQGSHGEARPSQAFAVPGAHGRQLRYMKRNVYVPIGQGRQAVVCFPSWS